MSEIKARFAQKHDVEVNWDKATNFIPKAGEIIVYDQDSSHPCQRLKIGNGLDVVSDLPFVNEAFNIFTATNIESTPNGILTGTLTGPHNIIDVYEALQNPVSALINFEGMYLQFNGYQIVNPLDAPDALFATEIVDENGTHTKFLLTVNTTTFEFNGIEIPCDMFTRYVLPLSVDEDTLNKGEMLTGELSDEQIGQLHLCIKSGEVAVNVNNKYLCHMNTAYDGEDGYLFTSLIDPFGLVTFKNEEQSYSLTTITVLLDLSANTWTVASISAKVATAPMEASDDFNYKAIMSNGGGIDGLKYNNKVTINPAHGRINARELVVTPPSSAIDQAPITIDGSGIYSGSSGIKYIGSLDAPFDTVYAYTFNANGGVGEFIGDLRGMADTAAADSQGRNIVNTYATKTYVDSLFGSYITDIDTLVGEGI